ncbi:MAG: glycosyltransferase family 4 protein [Pyrinomonadaceae bacterium]
MRVSYFYDSDIPSRFAAPIQILNTCRALGELGVRVTVYAGSTAGDAAQCLAFYGLTPHENLHIAALHSRWRPRRFDLWWKLPSLLRRQAASGERHFIVARGEDGVACRRLWMVGGTAAEVEALAQLTRAWGVTERVVLTGFVEPTRVPHFLLRAKVGVCPLPGNHSVTSELFTSPLKILELMAHGVPVVATDLPSVREILTHEQTGILAEPSNPQSLALALRRVLDNPAFAAQLRGKALAHVTAFSWQSRARRMLTFFHSLP